MFRPFIVLTHADDGEPLGIRCEGITSVAGQPAVLAGPDQCASYTTVEYFDGDSSYSYRVREPALDVLNAIENLERVSS